MQALVVADQKTVVQLAAEETEAEDLLSVIEDVAIESQDDLETAAEVLTRVKGRLKELDAEKHKIIRPLLDATNNVRNLFEPVLAYYRGCEKHLKLKIAGYHADRAQANQRLLAQAAVAKSPIEAAEAITQIDAPDKTEGVSVRDAWDFEVTDPEKVPRQYLTIDPVKIRKAMNYMATFGAEPTIEGVRFFKKSIVSSRAKS
jgi:hypothetical protein